MNRRGFTLIELMIAIAIVGILAAIAIPNFIAYRNKSFCSAVENDAKSLVSSISDYFATPTHDTIAIGDQSFIPPVNDYTLVTSNNNTVVTITVTDASRRCPVDYSASNPVNANGNGWIDGTTYQRRLIIN